MNFCRFSGVFLIIILCTQYLFSQQIGEVSVKKWKDDKNAAFSFSFDDAFESHYLHAREVLNQYGFKGTFYLTTGMLDDREYGDGYGTWNQFRQMAAEGHEMGAHTVTHKHLIQMTAGNINTPGTIRYEMYQSKLRIEQEIGQPCIDLAYPFAEYNSQILSIAEEFFEMARADGPDPNSASPTYKQSFKLTCNEMLFNLPRNSTHSDADELELLKSQVNDLINSGKWMNLMAHKVVPFSQLNKEIQDGSWYPMTREWLNDISLWMKNKSDGGYIWVETIANVMKYARERDSFKASVISSNGKEIKISVTDDLQDEIYNYPLTVDITVPSDWNEVVFTQGEKNQSVSTFTKNGKRIVRVEVIPDGGTVTLKNGAPEVLYSISGKVIYNNSQNSAVSNVNIQLEKPDNTKKNSLTDNNGNFSFAELGEGNYTIKISKDGSWGGVNATDALETLRYFSKLTQLDSLQMKAADVNNSGTINATDALLIVSRYAGKIDKFDIPDWIFEPASKEVIIDGSNIELQIKSIAAGDVNGSYIP